MTELIESDDPWATLPRYATYHGKLVRVHKIVGDKLDHAYIYWGADPKKQHEKTVALVMLVPADPPKPSRVMTMSQSKRKDGTVRYDAGDKAARLLRAAATVEDVYRLCEELGLPDVDKHKRYYMGLNNGMIRMNMGNRLRAFLRRQQKEQENAQ